jgi:drug/metabolite transporter (DMT)-like permease
MTVPKNVWWFEVLLYASLVLDALSVAFQDRTPTPRMTESMIGVSTLLALGLLVLLFYFVWLAARRKKSWPRWALSAALALSLISLAQVIGERGIQFDVLVDTVSCVLTALGLYMSFTGDAKDWFDA